MMKTISGWMTAALMFLAPGAMKAQMLTLPRWELGAEFGPFIYQGDLAPSLLGGYKLVSPGASVSGTLILTRHLSLRTSVTAAELRGDDRNYDEDPSRKARALRFTTSVLELTERVVWDVFGNNDDRMRTRVSPYVFAGLGYAFLDVHRDASHFDSAWFGLHPGIIDGLRADLARKTPRGVVVVPVGAGLRYALSPAWSVNIEANYRFSQTDYLDGFSRVANEGRNDHFYSLTLGALFTILPDKGMKCPKPDGTVF